MASHQQPSWIMNQTHEQANSGSVAELMDEHQRQWQEHLVMTGQSPGTMPPLANPLAGGGPSDMITKSMSMPVNNGQIHPNSMAMHQMNFNSASNLQINANYASSTNLSMTSTPRTGPASPNMSVASAPHITAAQYAAWQRQFQSANNGAFSTTNIEHGQIQGIYPQTAMNQRLFNQQRRMNGWGTTGQMDHGYPSGMVLATATGSSIGMGMGMGAGNGGGGGHHKPYFSNDDVDRMLEDPNLEQQASIDHVSFVPPAPQSKAEVEKYVQWQAQRKGIDEQKEIDRQVRKQMKAMGTEEPRPNTGPMFTTSSVRQISEYSEIDYALMEESSQKGKCCVVL